MRLYFLYTCLAICLVFLYPKLVKSDSLVEEQTILYYLIEMERKHGKGCEDSETSTLALPSLYPSPALSELSSYLEKVDKNILDFQFALGLEESRVFSAFAPKGNARQAMEYFKKMHCQFIMDKDFQYIGASIQNDVWSIVMASAEPDMESVRKVVEPGSFNPKESSFNSNKLEEESKDRSGITPLESNLVVNPSSLPLPANSVVGLEAKDTEEQGDILNNKDDFNKAGAALASNNSTNYTSSYTQDVDNLFVLINQVRESGYSCPNKQMPKVAPLKNSPVLQAQAMRHALDMHIRNYFATTSKDGTTLGKRLTDSNYSWLSASENIAKAQSPEQALNSWLSNASQCENILNSDYSEVGIGYAPEGNFWVVTLSKPSTSIRFD